MSEGPPYDQPKSLSTEVQAKLNRIAEFMEERSMIPAPLERVWLLRLEQKQDGPNECRRAVEGVALSEEDARMWEAESGEYRHTAEEVPVWHPVMMMISGDVDLDDPEIAEAMEDIRQAGAKRLSKLTPLSPDGFEVTEVVCRECSRPVQFWIQANQGSSSLVVEPCQVCYSTWLAARDVAERHHQEGT